MLTTGTGASGEILVTSPQINSSSITSPTITMRHSRARTRISSALFLFRLSKAIRAASVRFAEDSFLSLTDRLPPPRVRREREECIGDFQTQHKSNRDTAG